MRRLPIRIRLALVFSVAMALVLAGAGWFAYARVGTDLDRALDQQLRGRAQDLSALVRRGGSLPTTDGRLVEPGESFAQLLTRGGRVVDATPPLRHASLLRPNELAQAREHAVFVNRPPVPGLDEPARMLAVPLPRFVLVAGATRENRAEILSSLRDAFLIGGPLALLLASLAGYLLRARSDLLVWPRIYSCSRVPRRVVFRSKPKRSTLQTSCTEWRNVPGRASTRSPSSSRSTASGSSRRSATWSTMPSGTAAAR